ncbi:MAG: hypothetical protein HYU64_12800 [Armatimonadetes bacterium]|nr:hypothetical protein [Armatimonadota bacterium]
MVSRSVDLFGHLIDSHILSNAMDVILDGKGDFEVEKLQIGKVRQEPSFARITVSAPDEAALESILSQLHDMGASVVERDEVAVREAREDGVLPDGFYVTTNLETHVRVRAEWIPVLPVEMDCAISVEPDNRRATARPLHQVKAGNLIVCGRKGIKVVPVERSHLRDRRGATEDQRVRR